MIELICIISLLFGKKRKEWWARKGSISRMLKEYWKISSCLNRNLLELMTSSLESSR